MVIEFLDDQMTALHHTDFGGIIVTDDLSQNLAHPGSGGIDQGFGLNGFVHASTFNIN